MLRFVFLITLLFNLFIVLTIMQFGKQLLPAGQIAPKTKGLHFGTSLLEYYDTNNDGVLTETETCNMMCNLQKLDIDNDQRITTEELVSFGRLFGIQ